MPNLYEVLGLASSAEPEQVKAAFHRLAKSSHPDVNADDASAGKQFTEVNEAYDELAEKLRREQDEKRAAAEERARQEVEWKRPADAAAANKKEDEEALAIAQAAAVTKRTAEDAKQQAEVKRAVCGRAFRFHVMGLQEIEIGNVNAARQFFELGAKAGLPESAVALAGTYDSAELGKLNVVGLQPDVETAQKWYEKARDLRAMKALGADRTVCEEGEFRTMLALAADKPAADYDLAQFRAAYTSGDGLAYVVVKDEQGEHIYRYGDESRSAAKKDTRGYMLFTCNARHVFTPQKLEDKAALLRATVVKPVDPRFAELDAKYLTGCNNRLVKSAIPKS